jgi:undecaprenyl diphosphate synthase
MPLYKEQGIVLRTHRLGEADKIVTVMTQGSGKVRAVAKGVRKTSSRFGARLEPFTHVSLLVYRGRGALDTVTQAEIIAAHRPLRDDLLLFAAGEAMCEAVDKVAEEHERNVRLFLLLLSGLRALAARPADPSSVAESFLLALGVPPEPHRVCRVRRARARPLLQRAGGCGVPNVRRARRGARLRCGAPAPGGSGGGGHARSRRLRSRRAHPRRGAGAPFRIRRVPPRASHEEPADARQEPCSVSTYLHDIDRDRLPRHVGIVMDGNGRWAKHRGLPRTEGHAAGERAMWDTVVGAHEVGLRWLTMFAFSTENWNRPKSEVRYLMGFNRGLLRRRRAELHEMGVRVRFLGRRDWRVPRSVLREMQISEEMTRGNPGMTLTIAFNYGGRIEIVDAVKRILADHDAGRLRGEKLSPESIAARLYHPDMPDPDLIIRTSGEQRISNFLLWQAAYSELWFTPVLWPDFNREHLYEAIRDYQKRSRRFGQVIDD